MIRTVTGSTRVTGVIAHPVRHSLSPAMHNTAFRELGLDYIYVPFDVHPDNLEAAVWGMRALGIVGLNVTIPHKENVIRFLDWVSDDAQRIGSVNTIHSAGGELRGYSTDGYGFMKSLESAGKSADDSNVIIVGAGGSARAITYALAERAREITIINRTFARAVELQEAVGSDLDEGRIIAIAPDDERARKIVADADLLVNCTSVGMYPNVEGMPLPAEWLHPGLFVYDQIYNPERTRLLRAAEAAGARTANGVGMLVYQGARSFEIWTGRTPSVEAMEKAVLEKLRENPGASGETIYTPE